MTNGDASTIKLTCPACDRRCPDPFERGNLQPYTHTHNDDCYARFVVSVDPVGDHHRFRVLGRTTSFEEAMEEMRDEHQRRVKRAVLLDAAQRVRGAP